MSGINLFDKKRGQRMLLTKWIRIYNSTDDESEQEQAARKLADVLAWANSVGMSAADIAEDRDLPHRALELFGAGEVGPPAEDSELLEAERDVVSSVDTSNASYLGEGSGGVYVYGYACAPDRLKIGRTDGDVVRRIVGQINASTPDRPVLHLALATNNPCALERALHGALALRDRQVQGGGKEWFRTNAEEVLTIYRAVLGDSRSMTKLLNRAIWEVTQLPEADQDRIAHLILEELRTDAGWNKRFQQSEDKLAQLTKAARAEVASGDVLDEDPSSAKA